MQPIPVTIDDDTLLVPRLRVQQIIDLSTLRHESDRRDLVRDLEEAGVEAEERFAKLREHRDQAGLSSIIIRSAFTVQGAFQIIRLAMGGEFPDSMAGMEPTELSKIALQCLGLNLEDFESDSGDESRAEKKTLETIGESGSATPTSS
jgi:hypothetical protein